MLKENQKITIKWCGRNRKHYESLGYTFTGVGDSIEVDVDKLSKGSNGIVSVICDYCGKEVRKKYCIYLRGHDDKFGDACKDCTSIKFKKIMLDKYGVTNPSLIDEVKEKRKQTFIKNFGVDNASKSHIIKDRIKETWMEKYGVENIMDLPEFREKILASFVKNDNCPTSKMQEMVSDIVKDIYGKEAVTDNVQIGECILDILLFYKGNKIDIEYDGWYWHKDRQEQDKRRNYYLMDRGYKVLRIRSMEELPTKEQIKQGIDYLVEENHHLKIIDLDI